MLDRTSSPIIYPFADVALPEVESVILSNGATVSRLNSPDQQIVQIHFVWTGGKFDFENPAIPQLLCLCLRDGTMSHLADEIEEILDFNGATLKAVARDHHTVVTLTCLNGRCVDLLQILGEIIESPTFPNGRFVKAKERLKANIEVQRKKPTYHAEKEANRQISGNNHPINVRATPDLVDAVDSSDLDRARREIFQPQNLHVFAAGGLSDNVSNALMVFVNGLSSSGAVAFNSPIVPFDCLNSKKEVVTNLEGSLQSAVYMSIPSINREDENYCYLRMAVFALGGYFGSRLMANIREDKGLTYGITGGLLGYPEGSSVVISCQCDNRSVYQVIEETKKELIYLVENPPLGHELERIKQCAYTQLAMALDSPFNVIDTYLTYYVLGISPHYFTRQKEAIKQLSSQDISEVAQLYLSPERMYVSIAGDLSSMVK